MLPLTTLKPAPYRPRDVEEGGTSRHDHEKMLENEVLDVAADALARVVSEEHDVLAVRVRPSLGVVPLDIESFIAHEVIEVLQDQVCIRACFKGQVGRVSRSPVWLLSTDLLLD